MRNEEWGIIGSGEGEGGWGMGWSRKRCLGESFGRGTDGGGEERYKGFTGSMECAEGGERRGQLGGEHVPCSIAGSHDTRSACNVPKLKSRQTLFAKQCFARLAAASWRRCGDESRLRADHR